MKDFSKQGFRIARSSFEIRLVYTGFLIFALIGYLTMGLIGLLRVGPGVQEIILHYRGSGDEEFFGRTFGQILEDAHFHAFTEGLILLVLAHVFVATSVRASFKVALIVAAFGSTLVDLFSPWLIKYVAPGFAYLQMTSWAVMLTSALILSVVPVYEMWFQRGERES